MDNFISKIKQIKHIKIILIVVLILIMLAIYFGIKNNEKIDTNEETSISSILSKIEGVGNCYVYVSYKNGEKEVFSNVINNENQNIYGIVVVCDGGDNIKTKLKIIDAIKTLVDVDDLNIQVYKT